MLESDLSRWTEAYQARAKRFPCFFVTVFGELKAGDDIQIVVYPDVNERVKLGTLTEPLDKNDFEIPLAVIAENLTKENSSELRAALLAIQKTQGLDFDDGLLLMVHTWFWIVEWDRHRSGESSLLSGPKFRDLADQCLNDDVALMKLVMEHPLTSVDQLLAIWRKSQGHLARGIAKNRQGTPGLPSYKFFPPHWLSVNDLRRLNGNDEMSKVPVLMDADIAHLAPGMAKFLKVQDTYAQQPSGQGRELNDCRYLFKKGKDTWAIIYDGVEVHPPLRSSKGLDYIAFLLENPNKEYFALQIVHEVDGSPYEPDQLHSRMSVEELDEYGLSVSGFTDAGSIMDPDYEKDCQDRLRKALAELKLAEARNDTPAIRQAKGEIEQYRRALSEGTGLGGRRRTASNPAERARLSVNKCITRAREKIGQQHPSLYEHLRSSLHTGSKCIYDPTTHIDWKF